MKLLRDFMYYPILCPGDIHQYRRNETRSGFFRINRMLLVNPLARKCLLSVCQIWLAKPASYLQAAGSYKPCGRLIRGIYPSTGFRPFHRPSAGDNDSSECEGHYQGRSRNILRDHSSQKVCARTQSFCNRRPDRSDRSPRPATCKNPDRLSVRRKR